MDIWRLPRGSNTPLLAAGYLILHVQRVRLLFPGFTAAGAGTAAPQFVTGQADLNCRSLFSGKKIPVFLLHSTVPS